MSELKPCPFCGMNYAENAWGECGSEYWVCEFCGAASGTARDECNWNTRPIEDALNARIAELEGLVDKLIELGDELADDREYQDDLVDIWHDVTRGLKEREE